MAITLAKRAGFLAICWGMACGCAQADTTQKWNTASNVLTAAVPAMAAGMVLHQGDATGARELALSLGSALAAAELLKNTVHSTRPDGSDNKSFPSAQTALAFFGPVITWKIQSCKGTKI